MYETSFDRQDIVPNVGAMPEWWACDAKMLFVQTVLPLGSLCAVLMPNEWTAEKLEAEALRLHGRVRTVFHMR